MASNPPGQCCAQGVKHDGQPTGEIKQLGGGKLPMLPFPSQLPSQDTQC